MKARHRVPSMGSRLRRYEDPSRSRDPRVRAVVAQLQAVELPVPSANFRAELRAQLVAVAPRLVEDGVAEQRQALRTSESRAARQSEPARRKIRFGRPLAVVTTMIAVCALVLGGAVWLSQKSLPGDTLYGLKRASESWQLDLDTNDTDKATDYLHFSQRRVEEAQDLLHRSSASGAGIQADGISATTAKELNSALATADSQLLDGWKLLKATAENSHSSKPLATMTAWAPGQVERLTTLEHSLGKGKVLDRARQSTAFVHTAVGLAHDLKATLDKPSSAPASPTTRTGTRSGTHSGSGGKAGTPATKSATSSAIRTASTNRPAARPAATHAAPRSVPSRTAAASKSPSGLLPSLVRPLLRSHEPLVSSCGISLPIGGVHIGHCSSHS